MAASDPGLELWEGETDVYTVKGCEGIHPALSHDEDGTIAIRAGYFEEVLPKVLELAGRLGAVVQGDEGEFYQITEGRRETVWDRPDTTSSNS